MRARKVASFVLTVAFSLVSIVWVVAMPGQGAALYACGLVVFVGLAFACARQALVGHDVVRRPMISRAIVSDQNEARQKPSREYQRNATVRLA